jgi:hypothetical protein
MVSGLKANSYEEKLKELGQTTLEERRHQTDMTQVYKNLMEKDMVQSDSWFCPVNNAERSTRSTTDPLNLWAQAARLEVRKNFFSNRVVEDWNKISASLKKAKNSEKFYNWLRPSQS